MSHGYSVIFQEQVRLLRVLICCFSFHREAPLTQKSTPGGGVSSGSFDWENDLDGAI
jgi:hypothetical protein